MEWTGAVRRGVVALVSGFLTLTAAWAQAARVDASTSFEAVAAADGIRVGLRIPDAPATDTPVDSGGPTAQAVLNSSGVSRAFASNPYPGEAVVTGPGTVAGFTGGRVTPPAYPFAVQSDHPTVPEQASEKGPYRLKATSADRRSESEARVGADAGPVVTAHASAQAVDPGGAVAEAVSDVQALAVGEVRVGRVVSTAKVSSGPDGSLTRTSDFSVTGFTIAGTAVGIGPAGLTLPGGSVPLPPADPVRQALAGAGVTVTYLAPQQQPTGVVAAGVAVTAPVARPGGGTATVTYTLGQASAAVGAAPLPAAGDIDVVPPIVPEPPTEPGLSGDATPPPGSLPGSGSTGGFAPVSPLAPDRRGSSAGSSLGSSGDVAPASTAEVAATAPPPAGSSVLAVRRRGFDSASLFLVLAAAALVAFGLVSLFGVVGVRSRWTS